MMNVRFILNRFYEYIFSWQIKPALFDELSIPLDYIGIRYTVYRYNLTKHSQTIQNRPSSREFELQIVIYNLNDLIVLIQGLPYQLNTSNCNDKNRFSI